jgi:hypothetical protein
MSASSDLVAIHDVLEIFGGSVVEVITSGSTRRDQGRLRF